KHLKMATVPLIPVLLLTFFSLFTCIIQYNLPTFTDLFENLNKLTTYTLSTEIHPLLLTISLLIVPVAITAYIIRTFCRYIHDSTRNIPKTHLINSMMYIISIIMTCFILSILSYILILYVPDSKKSLILYFSKEFFITNSTIKLFTNSILILSLFLNCITYMLSTYLLENREMRRINNINGPILLDSKYITLNTIIISIIILIYITITSIFGYFCHKLFKSVSFIVYSFFIVSITHMTFSFLYMWYTEIPLRLGLISGEEKNDQRDNEL
ncbi:putative transporter, partial [Pseudoloma neurophilia]